MRDITLDDVRRLRLEPGDTLVFRAPDLSEYQAAELVDEMRHIFPNNQALVLYGDVDLEVMSGPGSA